MLLLLVSNGSVLVLRYLLLRSLRRSSPYCPCLPLRSSSLLFCLLLQATIAYSSSSEINHQPVRSAFSVCLLRPKKTTRLCSARQNREPWDFFSYNNGEPANSRHSHSPTTTAATCQRESSHFPFSSSVCKPDLN